jgi:transketolase
VLPQVLDVGKKFPSVRLSQPFSREQLIKSELQVIFISIEGISNSNLKMVGSHAGVSIGEDGPSQMAL